MTSILTSCARRVAVLCPAIAAVVFPPVLFASRASAADRQQTPLSSAATAAPQEPAPAPVPVTERMRTSAAALAPLVRAELAKQFLAATSRLGEPSTRTVYRNREKGIAVPKRVYDAMTAEDQSSLTPREYGPDFYYETGYGSPLVYVRILDLAAPHLAGVLQPKDSPAKPRRVLDFGYGTIGQLHLLARCGFDAHGVDVEPVFPALYSEPGDTGPMDSGAASIHNGQWPADEKLRAAIGGGYTLITSKNTLKNGYINPSPPAGQTVDPKKLVHLGVDNRTFLARVHDALLPGGVFVIYNICPPQNPPDKEYIPWADGASPFSRAMYEGAGFEVLAFDVRDDAWVLDCFEKLGYTEGKTREEAAKEFLCWYTIVRRAPRG